MAATTNVKTSEPLDIENDKSEKNVNESINDSGIEMSDEKEKVERNLTLKCPWILGQLAWARGSNYPFWPCVVTLDPKTLLYFKIQNKGRSQALMVHVQYFGDGGRHNWVLSHYIIPFSGLEDFQTRAKDITTEIKKKDPKYAASFSPKLGVKKQWGIGVTEASGLMHLSNEERASIFEPIIPQEQTAQLSNKLKRKLSSKGPKFPSDTPAPSPKKFKNIENGDQSQILISTSEPVSVEVSNLNAEPLINKAMSAPEKELSKDITTPSIRKSTRNQNKNLKETVDTPKRQSIRKKLPKISEEERNRRNEIDFEDYYNLNKEFWKADHPDATDEEIKNLLKDIWNEMDVEEKCNNLNRNFDDYRYNSTANPKVKRVPRTILQQEKENSKNTENAQQENNKKILQLNGKNVEEPVKNSVENEKNSESVKPKISPQKDKNKENDQDNVILHKEKSKIISETSDDSQNDKKEENLKTKEILNEKTESLKKKNNSSEVKETNVENKNNEVDGEETKKA